MLDDRARLSYEEAVHRAGLGERHLERRAGGSSLVEGAWAS